MNFVDYLQLLDSSYVKLHQNFNRRTTFEPQEIQLYSAFLQRFSANNWYFFCMCDINTETIIDADQIPTLEKETLK